VATCWTGVLGPRPTEPAIQRRQGAARAEAVNPGETGRGDNYCTGVTSAGLLIQAGPGSDGGTGTLKMVAATVRTIFEQADRASAQAQVRRVCEMLAARFPAVVQLIEAAEEEILTFYDFPAAHRRQVYSTNPLELASSQLTICA
jgi:Transposase, Mutator family